MGGVPWLETKHSFCIQLEDGKEYKYLEPTQKPINPPYKTALAAKRGQVDEQIEEPINISDNVEESMASLSIQNKVPESKNE